MVVQRRQAPVNATVAVRKHVTEASSQPAGAALRTGELLLTPTGSTCESWRYASAGRTDDRD